MSAQSDAVANALLAVTAAVAAAASDPVDQIRVLLDLAVNGTAAAGDPATAAICRRAAFSAIATAVDNYQPSSYDEAQATQSAITAAIDAEITVAGDAGDDASYAALRAMRSAIVQTLTATGAPLPRLVTVTRPRSLPSLALAWELYADASRSDDLIARADPPHPLWMPTSFEALNA